MSIFDDIGNSIVQIRREKHWSQERLALECEISTSYLRRIEHGQANPTIRELQIIAHALGVELQNPFPTFVIMEVGI